MTALRWKIYKALCWIAWRVCPDRRRIALGYIWSEGTRKVHNDLVARQEPLGAEFNEAIFDNLPDLYER